MGADRFVDDAKPLRVPPELFERADALIEAVQRDPEMRAMIGRMSASAILRIALVHGLRALERRYGRAEQAIEFAPGMGDLPAEVTGASTTAKYKPPKPPRVPKPRRPRGLPYDRDLDAPDPDREPPDPDFASDPDLKRDRRG